VEDANAVTCESVYIADEEPIEEAPIDIHNVRGKSDLLVLAKPGGRISDLLVDIDTILHGLQSLRAYCFPKPKPFIWNTCAKKFPVPLLENTEDYANCTVEFYSHLLEHTEANREENTRVTFDDSGEGSLAELRRAQDRLTNSKYLNRRERDDTKPVLCKIMNLIEFAPQNYLKRFAVCLRFDLMCLKEHDDKTFETVDSNQQRMKLYSFVRTTLADSDFDDSEDSYARNADACFANWHNQEDKFLHGAAILNFQNHIRAVKEFR